MTATAQSIFDNVPRRDEFNLFQGSEPNVRNVVDFLKYKKRDISVATGIPERSVRYDSKMPSELKTRAIEWAVAINLVGSYFKDREKTMLWFQAINPLLGNVSPRAMIRAGQIKKLLKFIITALDENKR